MDIKYKRQYSFIEDENYIKLKAFFVCKLSNLIINKILRL